MYGKTWYERHFNAILFNEGFRTIYKQLVSRFSDPSRFDSKASEAFILVNQPNDGYKALDKSKFKAIYQTCKTYNELFQRLKKEYPSFCEFVHNWINKFVDQQLQGLSLNQQWLIVDVPKIAWTGEPLHVAPVYNVKQVGGNTHTDGAFPPKAPLAQEPSVGTQFIMDEDYLPPSDNDC